MKNKEVSHYINSSLNEQIDILNELRRLIFSVVPNVNEQYKWSRPVYSLEKDFCYIKTTKKHVTFGFMDFNKITTNKENLEGTGEQMRHIKIKKISEISEFKIGQMIKEVIG